VGVARAREIDRDRLADAAARAGHERDGRRHGASSLRLAAVDASRPFGDGSISLRCYPHLDLGAPEIVAEMRVQGALAAEHGFDGVMTSEHHGGFAGYLPNPIQLAGFLLDAMPRGWAAACPVVATLRPAALIAEETAWLAARHPERVGVGLAAGALE